MHDLSITKDDGCLEIKLDNFKLEDVTGCEIKICNNDVAEINIKLIAHINEIGS